MFSNEILGLAKQVIALLSETKMKIVSAESCTGGLIVSALTEISGSSSVVYGGYITYANEAKNNMINVPIEQIKKYGAVSKQVAEAMAKGALKASKVDIAISVTGIAGPSGGTRQKPVGLVHFALANKDNIYHKKMNFGADKSRDEIRIASVKTALNMILEHFS